MMIDIPFARMAVSRHVRELKLSTFYPFHAMLSHSKLYALEVAPPPLTRSRI